MVNRNTKDSINNSEGSLSKILFFKSVIISFSTDLFFYLLCDHPKKDDHMNKEFCKNVANFCHFICIDKKIIQAFSDHQEVFRTENYFFF